MKAKILPQLLEILPHDLKDRALFLTVAGSHSYGTALPESDIDIRGFCLEPESTLFGLTPFEQFEYNKDGLDIVIYGLKKFFKLLLKGSPNIIEILATRPEDILLTSSFGLRVKLNLDLFLSKKLYHSYKGFAFSQNKNYFSDDLTPAQIAKKTATLARLAQMGTEILSGAAPRAFRPNCQELLDIRNGKYLHSDGDLMDEFILYSGSLFEKLEEAYDDSPLPDQPNFAAAEKLLISIYNNAIAAL